jgi:tRNA(Ile)-lysidine synthase
VSVWMIDLPGFQCQLLNLTPKRRFVVAISAGVDSTALLDVMAQLRPDVAVRAIHVNHGVQQHADAWQVHCQSLCDQYGIALCVKSIAHHFSEDATGNFEARARQWRYHALFEDLQTDEVLLTAHHQQDQAETLLLQLFRGAGPMGLAAMPNVQQTNHGTLIRPLLTYDANAIHAHAVSRALRWMDDVSNTDQHYQRNHIRHSVLPSLQQRWPAMVPLLARSASHCAEMSSLANELAALDMAVCRGVVPGALSAPALRDLSAVRCKNLLRFWIKQQGVILPSQRRLGEVMKQVLTTKQDRMPVVSWADVQLRLYRGQLYLLPLYPEIPKQWQQHWDGKGEFELPSGVGTLVLDECMLTADWVVSPTYEVRFRRGGEVFKPRGGHYHVKLKKVDARPRCAALAA